MSSGFCLTAHHDDVELQMFDADNSLMQVAEHNGVHAVLLGRVYYHGDLARRLGQAFIPDRSARDVSWVLAAYGALGVDMVEAIEGEFAIVILDRNKRQVFAFRDPCGGYPLYWTNGVRGFGIASLLRPLTGFIRSSGLDAGLLGEVLTVGYAEIDYFPSAVIDGIKRLVPGTSLKVDLSIQNVRECLFWDWRKRIVEPRSDDLEQIGTRYRELLRAAIDERSRGIVAAHISGGMDSTAVAYLALDRLAASGQPLHGVSIAYDTLHGLRDEAPYLEAALSRPGIVSHRIAGDDVLDFDHLDNLPLLDEPCPGLFRAGTDRALVQAAVASGADTVLTGLGADELLSDAPFYIADLIRSGRIGLALSEAARWGQATNTSRWRFFRSYGLSPVLPAWVQTGLITDRTIERWVETGFARKAALHVRARSHVWHNTRSAKAVVLSEALARLRYTAGDWTRNALALGHGLHVAHPFRDPRLVAFALGVRTRVRPDPHRQKAVLSSAMRSILPPVILDRRGKAPFNPVYFRGLSRNLGALEAMIRASPVDELFDKNRMIFVLRKAALGGQAIGSTSLLNSGIAIAHWMSHLPRWTAALHEPSRVIRFDLTQHAPPDTGLARGAHGLV